MRYIYLPALPVLLSDQALTSLESRVGGWVGGAGQRAGTAVEAISHAAIPFLRELWRVQERVEEGLIEGGTDSR